MNNDNLVPNEKEEKVRRNRHRYIEKNKISIATKSSMKMRILVGLLLACIGIPCLILGGWWYFALIFVVLLFSIYEIVHAPTNRKFSLFVTLVTYIIIIALVFWLALKSYLKLIETDPNYVININEIFSTTWLSPIAITLMAGTYFLVVVLKEDFDVADACYLIAMGIIVALAFQSILYLRYAPYQLFKNNPDYTYINVESPIFQHLHSVGLIVYILIGTMFNDIGAYFVGVLFGRNKINPRISPNKTYEGFWGGIVISALLSFGFAFILATFNYPILPNLSMDKWYWIVLLSVSMPLVANLGDFTFSAIKRYFGIKDFSKIFGPHGGALDRFDSLLFVAIMVTSLLTLINNNWNFLS